MLQENGMWDWWSGYLLHFPAQWQAPDTWGEEAPGCCGNSGTASSQIRALLCHPLPLAAWKELEFGREERIISWEKWNCVLLYITESTDKRRVLKGRQHLEATPCPSNVTQESKTPPALNTSTASQQGWAPSVLETAGSCFQPLTSH